ncbi:uncharacterized protein [Anolis sagrei]|uniref:uncharacterized protein isoform X4 n=1 Tax=Anolis sagrei TaxID=38937 RepID=UPI003521FDE5
MRSGSRGWEVGRDADGAKMAASSNNPRKFSEKIALHNQKQAEETAAFEEVMKDLSLTRAHRLQLQKNQYLQLGQSRGQYYGGSLPNVNQIGSNSMDLPFQTLFQSSGLDTSRTTRHHGLVDRVYRDRNRLGSPHRRPLSVDKHGRQMDSCPYSTVYLSPPSDTSWRRTNSDSALHQSTMTPAQEEPFLVCSQDMQQKRVLLLSVPGMEEKASETDKSLLKQGWEAKKTGSSRPKSCEVPGINSRNDDKGLFPAVCRQPTFAEHGQQEDPDPAGLSVTVTAVTHQPANVHLGECLWRLLLRSADDGQAGKCLVQPVLRSHSELGEVQSHSIEKDAVHWSTFGFGSSEGLPARRPLQQVARPHTTNDKTRCRKGQTDTSTSRSYGVNYCSDSPCETAFQTLTILVPVGLRSFVTQTHYAPVFACATTQPALMVGVPTQCLCWTSFSSAQAFQNSDHGLFAHGVGSTCGWIDYPRDMDLCRSCTSHKPYGVVSGREGTKVVRTNSEMSGGPVNDRQYNSDVLYKQTGRNSLKRVAEDNTEGVELVHRKKNSPSSDSSARRAECPSRLFEQKSSHSSRVDSKQTSCSPTFSGLGRTGDRSFCLSPEHAMSNILCQELQGFDGQLSRRCVSAALGETEVLCVPPVPSDTSGGVEASPGPSARNSGHFLVAKTTVVFLGSRGLQEDIQAVASEGGPADGTGRSGPISGCPTAEVDSVAHISSPVRLIIEAAQRQSTKKNPISTNGQDSLNLPRLKGWTLLKLRLL